MNKFPKKWLSVILGKSDFSFNSSDINVDDLKFDQIPSFYGDKIITLTHAIGTLGHNYKLVVIEENGVDRYAVEIIRDERSDSYRIIDNAGDVVYNIGTKRMKSRGLIKYVNYDEEYMNINALITNLRYLLCDNIKLRGYR